MYEILMAVDQNEDRALTQVDAIVDMPQDPSNVRVHLVHDFTDNPAGASISQVASVRRAMEKLESEGFDVELVETSGDPADEIIETADELDVNVIVLAARKRTPTGKVLFGSVTQAVILGTSRPVMVCGGKKR